MVATDSLPDQALRPTSFPYYKMPLPSLIKYSLLFYKKCYDNFFISSRQINAPLKNTHILIL